MATLQLDPDSLRARYRELIAEAEKVKRIIDILPELESYSTSAPSQANGHAKPLPPLRPVSADLKEKVREFIVARRDGDFTVPDALEWLAINKPVFDSTKERDAVTFALRHFVDGEQRLLTIKTPGVGRRLQVYTIIQSGKAPA